MDKSQSVPSFVIPRMPPPFWVTALYIVIAVGVLWFPTQWLIESVQVFHGQRTLTPALLPKKAGPEPSLIPKPPTEIRAAPVVERSIVFRLLAPAARDVFLGGSFNHFKASDNPMVKGADGIWETTVPLLPGRYTYKFKVDGDWLLDPTNPEKTPQPRETSLIDVPS